MDVERGGGWSTNRGSRWSVCLQMCWQRLWGSGWDKTINTWPTLRCGQWLLIRHGSCIGVSVTSSLGDGMTKATLAATCFPQAPSRTLGVRSAGDHRRRRSLPWRWQLFEITLTVTGHCLLCDAIQHFTVCCGWQPETRDLRWFDGGWCTTRTVGTTCCARSAATATPTRQSRSR